jgi:hypothetical protein
VLAEVEALLADPDEGRGEDEGGGYLEGEVVFWGDADHGVRVAEWRAVRAWREYPTLHPTGQMRPSGNPACPTM